MHALVLRNLPAERLGWKMPLAGAKKTGAPPGPRKLQVVSKGKKEAKEKVNDVLQ